MKQFTWFFLSLFCFLFILTFEFDYSLLPNIYLVVNPFFESLSSFAGVNLFGLEKGFDPSISSDSIGFYIHAFNLVIISALMALVGSFVGISKEVNLRNKVLKILTYYLSLQLLIYGSDKFFKAQFFLPEPNTLFTPLKDISKDLLYWSTIGSSRGYSMFLGGLEILTAGFLLIRKTRLIGILMGIGILINVVAVNLSFNISVKGYSLFLLFCFIGIGTPYFKYLYQIFLLKKSIDFPKEVSFFTSLKPIYNPFIKGAIILLFLLEALLPYLKTANFNDDTHPRPLFHGAYEIVNPQYGLERVFIHRHGYLIFQNDKDDFKDFQLELDSNRNEMVVFDYERKKNYTLKYKEKERLLVSIHGSIEDKTFDFNLRKTELKNTALLAPNFDWIAQ